jgi:hypothetical protein
MRVGEEPSGEGWLRAWGTARERFGVRERQHTPPLRAGPGKAHLLSQSGGDTRLRVPTA